ncbi:hypothetical protein M409DRAFT_29756 [Zasmidium cellare ATCC 36951]|uniref:Uncharacterized protein n=1 Tax=Zasmidium cellare ATCC 36951 TaxID=1080233 RepID=A0A6A6C1Q3_ZASCE|nr:uncharacterized protein M409DRAFT_29756 [Zasmidium cellare ATCC 36951]KAF2159752.1 hypothetical protein M409DRAFT_29756 [Zasmidium cellare ATCC 36951]
MSTNSNRPNTKTVPTPFGALFKLPVELRLNVWELVVYSAQEGEVNYHQTCYHRYSLPYLSKAIQAEIKTLVEKAGGSCCKHIVFRITLPTFEEMPEREHRMKLLSSIQERDGLSGDGGHDISQANVLVFETGHLGDDAPDTVVCYLERGTDCISYDILGGTAARYEAVGEELLKALTRAKNALTNNIPVAATAGMEDGEETSGLSKAQVQHDAMTYLAERVRIAVCEEIEELPEPRLLGPGIYSLSRVRELGLSVRVLDAGSGEGGAWSWCFDLQSQALAPKHWPSGRNRYPGCRFDSESYTYGFSFSQQVLDEWTWTEYFPPQPETLKYAQYLTGKFDLRK